MQSQRYHNSNVALLSVPLVVIPVDKNKKKRLLETNSTESNRHLYGIISLYNIRPRTVRHLLKLEYTLHQRDHYKSIYLSLARVIILPTSHQKQGLACLSGRCSMKTLPSACTELQREFCVT